MEPETRLDALRSLWQDQPVEPLTTPVADLRVKADSFRATIAARNKREWVAAALVAVMFTVHAIVADTALGRAGHILEILAAVYVAWHLRAHGRSRTPEGLPCLTYYRRELERQRDLLRGIWRWYLGPPIPGVVVLVVDGILNVWAVAGFIAVFGLVGWINGRAAAELQRQLDALPATELPSG